MKQLFLLFLLFFTTDSYSSGISGGTNTAPCDNDTLSKYTGTVDAEVNWEPNVINLKWFNGDTELNVAAASQTCTYDGMITVPPAPPQKLGYTFNGWKIPKIDFATIPTNEEGTERWAIGWRNNADYCYYDTNTIAATHVTCGSDSTYNELQTHKWKVKFNHGDLYGISVCSTTNGNHGQTGNPTIDFGQYCWCKATGYKATNTAIVNGSLYTLPWVFRRYDNGNGTQSGCAQVCSIYCARDAESSEVFLRTLLTPAQ